MLLVWSSVWFDEGLTLETSAMYQNPQTKHTTSTFVDQTHTQLLANAEKQGVFFKRNLPVIQTLRLYDTGVSVRKCKATSLLNVQWKVFPYRCSYALPQCVYLYSFTLNGQRRPAESRRLGVALCWRLS